MGFKQDGAMSSLKDKPLKLVDQFIYLSSKMLSTEIGKAWAAIDPIYPTPPLGQDMTQGQFLSRV